MLCHELHTWKAYVRALWSMLHRWGVCAHHAGDYRHIYEYVDGQHRRRRAVDAPPLLQLHRAKLSTRVARGPRCSLHHAWPATSTTTYNRVLAVTCVAPALRCPSDLARGRYCLAAARLTNAASARSTALATRDARPALMGRGGAKGGGERRV